MRNAPLLAMLFVVAGAAHAADWSPAPAEFATATPRETFLATGIAGSITIGLASFFFAGRIMERTHVALALLSVLVVLAAWRMKERYWLTIDSTSAPSTVASATLLGSRGEVRMLEPPHSEENYLLKEMGFRIARKHRLRLRRVVRLAGFALPALASFLALLLGGVSGAVAAGIAVLSAAVGLLVERWLFFAEAKHTVMLYYGANAV